MSGRRPPQASLPDKETRYRADTTVAITEPGAAGPYVKTGRTCPGTGGGNRAAPEMGGGRSAWSATDCLIRLGGDCCEWVGVALFTGRCQGGGPTSWLAMSDAGPRIYAFDTLAGHLIGRE